MKKAFEIIKKLENEKSTNGKIKIISENEFYTPFVNTLIWAYNEDKYGFNYASISKGYAKYLSNKPKTPLPTWNFGENMIKDLASNSINNELRTKTYVFLDNCDEDERELWMRILTKNLKCNISVTSINKAIPGLIYSWGVQGGIPREEVKLKDGEWFALTLKLNGIRGTMYGGQIRSRQNKVIGGFDYIIKQLNKLSSEMFDEEMVFDGELIRINVDNVSDNENFRLTNSIVSSKAKEKPGITFRLFDVLPRDEFEYGESVKTYKDRIEILKQIKSKIEKLELKNISVVPILYEGTDQNIIDKKLDEVDKQGLEGLMLARDVKYKCKKHNGLLKCKKFKEGDFKVVGFKEGAVGKKYEGTLGALLVEYKDNVVGVDGMSDKERDDIWNNQDEYIGKIVEVKYKEVSYNKTTGLPSLQFASFIRVRHDKTEPNY